MLNIIRDPINPLNLDNNGIRRVHIPYIGDVVLSGGDLILAFVPYFLLSKEQKMENRGIKHDAEKKKS